MVFARSLELRSSSFSARNSRMLISSWEKTLITRAPPIISSMKPFSLPRCRCCCPKYFPDCVATFPLVNRIPEVMTRVMAVSGMFRMHMLTKTLTMLVMEFISCGNAIPIN